MPARQDASPDDIEMSSIFSALRRALPKLLAVAAVFGGLTYAGLMTIAPKYQSLAELQIVAKSPGGNFSDKGGTTSESVTVKVDKEAINTHVRALQSADLVTKIADQMELREKKEFNSALGPIDLFDTLTRLVGVGGPRPGESERDRVLNALLKNIEVYSTKESRAIGLRVTSVNPELAADIANRLAETYRTSLAATATQEVDDQQKVLQGKIDKLSPEVAAAETEVERYRGEINVFKGGSQNTGLNEQQLSELTAELTKAKAARSEADARATAAREMAKAGAADALPDVQKSPLMQNLVQQRVRIERQISELSATLLPAHPRMKQLNTELAELKRQIATEVAKVVEGLEKEAKTAQSREDSIKKSLDEIKTRVVDKAPEEAKLRQLEASARAKRIELESLQSQLESNRKRQDTRAQPVEAQIMTRAAAASLPVFPKKGQNAALVAFATLLFGTFWTITRALFDGARGGGVRTGAALDKKAVGLREEPALAAAQAPREEPKVSKKKMPVVAPVADASGVLAIQDAAARIVANASNQGGYRALLTGETQAVDAAKEAIALAKAMSADGHHVMLVDWSPSGEGIGSDAGVKSGQGLTELLMQTASFEDVVERIPDSNAHFIACGAPLNDVEDLDPDQLNLVLDALDEAYDFIIVAGRYEDCRVLFEAIQGRFDAGVLVADPKKPGKVLKDPEGTLLGFEVADIDVMHVQREPAVETVSPQRIMRAVRRTGMDARQG